MIFRWEITAEAKLREVGKCKKANRRINDREKLKKKRKSSQESMSGWLMAGSETGLPHFDIKKIKYHGGSARRESAAPDVD
jgi:hypothetical protein